MDSQGVRQDLVALTGPQAKPSVTQSSSVCPSASRNQADPGLAKHLTTGVEGCEAKLSV